MASTLTFLSHADEDKIIAERIAEGLKEYHFDVFLAHKDIEPGSDWENILKKRIEESDLFLILLSSKFKNADYTNQEVGIAICLKKRIFPFSIDGTMPYGFMSKYQSSRFNVKNIDKGVKLLSELFRRAVDGTGTLRNIDEQITALRYASSFVEANKIADELSTHLGFTDGQLNGIANAYNVNYEVRGSWTAGPFVLNLLKKTEKNTLVDSKWRRLL